MEKEWQFQFVKGVVDPEADRLPEEYLLFALTHWGKKRREEMHEITREVTIELLKPYRVVTVLWNDARYLQRELRKAETANGLAEDFYRILKAYGKETVWAGENCTLFLTDGYPKQVYEYLHRHCWKKNICINEYWSGFTFSLFAFETLPDRMTQKEVLSLFDQPRPDLELGYGEGYNTDGSPIKELLFYFPPNAELEQRVRDVVKRVCAKWGVAPEWRV